MNICAKCGAPSTALNKVRLSEYKETILGLPVVLVNAVDRFTCSCGHCVDVVANQEGLLAAVSLCRVLIPVKFNGSEIKLLRMAMNIKSKELAKKLGVTPEAVSRWEAAHEPMGAQTEKMFRLTAALALMPNARAIDVDLKRLMAMQPSPVRPTEWEPVQLELVRFKVDHDKHDGWDMVEPLAA